MEIILIDQKLSVDSQTLSDLAIFGRSGTGSIFSLFDRTVSYGGSQLLEALFRQPLADVAAINARAAVYRFFSEHPNIAFPVDSETLGTLAYYLSNEDVRSQLHSVAESFSEKLKGVAAADAEEKFVVNGVDAALRLFARSCEFIESHDDLLSASPFAESFV